MKLIPHRKFRRLRLNQFETSPEATNEESGWEFMGGHWYSTGEYLGASFLRPDNRRAGLAAICLDFQYVRPELANCILNTLCLPLNEGASISEVFLVLGNSTKSESDVRVPGYITHYFHFGGQDGYVVICYFHDERLRGVDIFREDMIPKGSIASFN